MTNIEFVDDSVVPAPKSRGGRIPHPLDVAMSDALRQNPGRWAKYPIESLYPGINLASDEGFEKAINRARVKISARAKGAYRASEGERFSCSVDRSARVIYVRYTKES